MEEIIEALNHDASLGMERRVSVYHPHRVKAILSNETEIADYEETTEDIFADIRWDLEIEALKRMENP